jgi:hypothetical protein
MCRNGANLPGRKTQSGNAPASISRGCGLGNDIATGMPRQRSYAELHRAYGIKDRLIDRRTKHERDYAKQRARAKAIKAELAGEAHGWQGAGHAERHVVDRPERRRRGQLKRWNGEEL